MGLSAGLPPARHPGGWLRRLQPVSLGMPSKPHAFPTNSPCPKGLEQIALALQIRSLSDNDTAATVMALERTTMSVRGKFLEVSRLRGLLPCVRSAYVHPTSYIWNGAEGVQHQKHQAEGGDCSSVIHDALKRIHIRRQTRACAHSLTMPVWSHFPNAPVQCMSCLATICKTMAGIQLHAGKSRLWNLAGHCHEEVEELDEEVWNPGGLELLGTPWD